MIYFRVLTACLLFIISGCVVVEQPYNKASQLAVSSVWDIPTTYARQNTFALAPKYLDEVSLKPQEQQRAYQLYSDAISRNLVNNGYYQTNGQANFYVGFGVALAQDLNDKTIGNKFGVTPGLQEAEGLEKGSFLIYVEDAVTQQRIWRGTVQGFVQEDYTQEERNKRIEKVVNMVLVQFYRGG